MRLFQGNRNTNKKKGIAGMLYKLRLTGNEPLEMTADEKYQKMFDDKLAKIMAEVAQGKKKGFVLPGTVQDNKPKEMSKGFKETMEKLARMKVEKALQKQKKKQNAIEAKKREIKREKEAKKNAELLRLQMVKQQQELEYQQQQQQQQSSDTGSYFFGSTEDKKDGWW